MAVLICRKCGFEQDSRNILCAKCNEIMPAGQQIKPEPFNRPINDNKGPPSIMVITWNHSMQQVFDKGRKPKAGRRYALKCERFDGLRAYFTLEQI